MNVRSSLAMAAGWLRAKVHARKSEDDASAGESEVELLQAKAKHAAEVWSLRVQWPLDVCCGSRRLSVAAWRSFLSFGLMSEILHSDHFWATSTTLDSLRCFGAPLGGYRTIKLFQ